MGKFSLALLILTELTFSTMIYDCTCWFFLGIFWVLLGIRD